MLWMKPAILFSGLASAVLAATFCYVWSALIRRRFVLLWSLGWTAAVGHLAFSWRLVDRPGALDWTIAQVFLVTNALLVVGGCFDFVHRRLPVPLLAALALPFLVWTGVAPRITDRFLEIVLPSSALLAASYLWTAALLLRLHRLRGTRGARVAAILFAAAGLHELDYPLLGRHPWGAPLGYSIAALLALTNALCLLVMVLEESRADTERERARLRSILDNLPVGVLVAGPAGEIVLDNPAARDLTGRALAGDAAAAVETEILRLPGGRPVPPGEAPLSQALARGEPTPATELALPVGDGGLRAVLVNAGPVRDGRGGAVAVLQDIDELKKMQGEVARSQRLQSLGTLAAGVAHDFNNALTMILGHAELALERTEDVVVRQQVEIIRRVAADSASIVRRIQDVARTRVSRDQVPVDLAAVVREVVDIARPRWRDEAQAQGRSYDVRTELAHDVTVLGQPAELREALLNLVFNALDAMPQGGTLALSVARRAGEAVLAVRDSGTGMSAEVRERVFEPYFTTKGQLGTGLGLAVVFGIVQRHDGRIEVASEPGRGACFTLAFPLHLAAAVTAPAAAPPPARAAQRILVVDDEPLVRGLMTSLLRLEGHDVAAAENGEEALAVAARNELDLVLTDLGMPGMNGWEVAAGVRELRPSARVVLVTGWGEAVSQEEAAGHGVCAVLSKPFTRAQLVHCIEQLRRSASELQRV